MIRHGKPPYLECSSKGDKRFSAFYARIKGRGNQRIEDIYQAAKVFEDGTTGLCWKRAKGRKAINQEEVTQLYSKLWDEYIAENPELLHVLHQATGVQDLFGQPNHCCQATELWRIRNMSQKPDKSIEDYEWVAIIGSREPTEKQEIEVIQLIEQLDPTIQAIVSGCADGIDKLALTTGQNLGFKTIGMLPWKSYNEEAQQYCDFKLCLDELDKDVRLAAYESVYDHHPAAERLSNAAIKLHARNYMILRWASAVIAAPSTRAGGGGTGQGIRLAQTLNKPLIIIKP